MNCYREKTSILLARLAGRNLSRKRPSRSPAPQTSPSATSRVGSFFALNSNIFRSIPTVFKLPDELILSILSYVSPDPCLSGHYARFHMSYDVTWWNCHDERAQFLRPLSMTCMAMRLRLLSWVWGRLEISPRFGLISMEQHVQELSTILNGPHTDRLLASSVKYFCPLLCPWISTDFISFDEGSRGHRGPAFGISLNV